ncbi:hypothetical protein GUITHDRAFT_118688 [Guillardia theta CCMP2712]|uniref:Uncharacterized protein n=2 Tax=Guillardia theta TaxID=55529 RepID=L1IBU0_GUITC|nr:hypothetical protein GUITHDRAFT_120448 [Guillardia theta CCMP2712]XP_005822121.1 hypothetical protein GUITHDRAFT_118688 [Guillardia theta CCMP2712]EKX33384.1 hypothetical protein GUITHDRAFT_120448 [Guillardia theta CCMP2712]EKX35141.1 hypothetical protein GUITHDRAFT_118688 [Guillardia theta CCMP2712]|eukprot:XP_005820364.1 hypothetical protein GUITHDRAFT_120448 [Guillardia theta CCMP2712]
MAETSGECLFGRECRIQGAPCNPATGTGHKCRKCGGNFHAVCASFRSEDPGFCGCQSPPPPSNDVQSAIAIDESEGDGMSVSSRTSQLDDGMEGPSSMFQDPTAAARTNKARPKRKHSSTEAESALWDNLRVQDEAALEASVEAIRENTISKKSRKMYTSSMIRLLQWLYVNRKEVLTKEFRELMEDKIS